MTVEPKVPQTLLEVLRAELSGEHPTIGGCRLHVGDVVMYLGSGDQRVPAMVRRLDTTDDDSPVQVVYWNPEGYVDTDWAALSQLSLTTDEEMREICAMPAPSAPEPDTVLEEVLAPDLPMLQKSLMDGLTRVLGLRAPVYPDHLVAGPGDAQYVGPLPPYSIMPRWTGLLHHQVDVLSSDLRPASERLREELEHRHALLVRAPERPETVTEVARKMDRMLMPPTPGDRYTFLQSPRMEPDRRTEVQRRADQAEVDAADRARRAEAERAEGERVVMRGVD